MKAVLALGMRSRERRVLRGGSVAGLPTEAERRPSSFKAGTSRTTCGPPVLNMRMVGEAALALHYKSEQSMPSHMCVQECIQHTCESRVRPDDDRRSADQVSMTC